MEKLLNVINKQSAAEAEKQGKLIPEWIELIQHEKWFKLFVPKHLNGLELSLPEALRVEETLAKMDGSLAWTVTLCAGATWFAGFLDPELTEEVFLNDDVCFAGSGFIGGTANKIGEHYIINGNWTYASGALHATHFTANCLMLENGKAIMDADGKQTVKAFLLKKQEVEILDGWSYMGMVATGSHAFKATEQFIPLNRCFEILPNKTRLPEPIFKYPFLQLAETTLVANVLGITLHFIELVDECFWMRNKTRNYDKAHLDYYTELKSDSEQHILNLRLMFFDLVEQSYTELKNTYKISGESLQAVSEISRDLASACREVSAKLQPFAGLEAAKNHTEINRVWRDMNTVSQHALLIFPFKLLKK